MNRKPKLSDVAELAGVSVSTASQVMRGAGRISDDTTARVRKAADKLRYVVNERAASMRSGNNREIGFVINQIANPFNAEVISGVSDLLEDKGYLVSVLDARDDPVRQHQHLASFIRSGRAGLLWVPAFGTREDDLELLKSHRVPTVTFLRKIDARAFDHIGVANEDATATATRYLVDAGHREIAYLGGTTMTTVRSARIAGYKKTLQQFTDCDPIVWDCDDNKLAGLDQIQALRSAHPQVTAVVCNGDMVALGALLGLQRMGLRAGKDLAVVGFDDIQDAAASTPTLTTMSICPYKLGQRLAQTLLRRLESPESPIEMIEVTARLIERDSATPKPCSA